MGFCGLSFLGGFLFVHSSYFGIRKIPEAKGRLYTKILPTTFRPFSSFIFSHESGIYTFKGDTP